MHLVLNAMEIGRQRGGNETFIAGLVGGLDILKPDLKISLLTCQWLTRPPLPFPQHNLGSYQQLPFLLWQQSLALRHLKADWYVSNFFLPPISRCKGAVVVHDLSFRAYPDYFPRFVAWYMHWLAGLAIHQADLVCTVSDFSRQELYRFYPRYQGDVHLVPNGLSPIFQPAVTEEDKLADLTVLARYDVKPPYIFALGNIHPRKNLGRLLEAYMILKRDGHPVPTMVWGGTPRWESHALLDQAKAAGVVLTGFIVQADLPAFYRQTNLLVYPSLYEGFGLPPLEAMACGTPSIVSNTTSLPEAVGQAALTVDPLDPKAIAAAIVCLLGDQELRQALVEAGLKHVMRFTWQRSAESLVNGIEAIEE